MFRSVRLAASFAQARPLAACAAAARRPAAVAAARPFSAVPAPSRDEIQHRVMVLLKEFDKVDHAKLTPAAHFIKDLGLDSLDQVEITMALEEEFHIEIPDKDAEEIMTAEQAIEKVYGNKNAL